MVEIMILGGWHKGPVPRRLGYKPEKTSKSSQLIKSQEQVEEEIQSVQKRGISELQQPAIAEALKHSISLNDCFYKPSASESPELFLKNISDSLCLGWVKEICAS